MQTIEQERYSWLKLFLVLLWLLLIGGATVLFDDGASPNLDDAKMILVLKLSQVLGVLVIFIAPAILLSTLWTRARFRYTGLVTMPALTTMVLAGLGIVVALPLINWLAQLNQQLQLPAAFSGIEAWMKSSEAKAAVLTDAMTRGSSVGDLLFNLFVIAFMAALSEELFFRGILQKLAIECFKNRHAGIWFSAIIFSAFHMQFYGFLPRMLMGAYLGYLFAWSGSLWPGILAHFLNNGTAVFLIWLSNRGSIPVDADKVGTENSAWMYVICSAVMVAGSLVLVRRKEKQPESIGS